MLTERNFLPISFQITDLLFPNLFIPCWNTVDAITQNAKDSIVMDFFSGLATTAHAVMQLNSEDEGKRRFIMVQVPELNDEKSEAYKAGYKTIAEIGKERIRRAGKKIKKEAGLMGAYLHIGFRVLKGGYIQHEGCVLLARHHRPGEPA
jgi:hypothetical protein